MGTLSRRRLIRNCLGTAAVFGVESMGVRALAPRQPLGIQLYTVGAELQKDVRGTLAKVRSIGYTEVETAGFAGLTAQQFRGELERAGLACHSAHLPMNAPDLAPVLNDAKSLGARYAVCSAMLPPGAPSVEGYKHLAARLNQIGRQAKQFGLQYAYHNHNMEFRKLEGGRIGYDILLAETDPSLVDFEIDCGWMIVAGYHPQDYFQKFPHRIKMLHLKDFVRTNKPSTSLAADERPQGTELGRGFIDYKPVLEAAMRVPIEHYFVEQEPPFPDMPALAAARVDFAYLQRLRPFA